MPTSDPNKRTRAQVARKLTRARDAINRARDNAPQDIEDEDKCEGILEEIEVAQQALGEVRKTLEARSKTKPAQREQGRYEEEQGQEVNEDTEEAPDEMQPRPVPGPTKPTKKGHTNA
jgi:hypothetical protein